MNTVKVSANEQSASIIGKNFAADIEPEYCLVELKNHTFGFNRADKEQIDNLETLIQLLRGIWGLE